MRRKLLWVVAIVVVLVGIPLAVWFSTGPQTRLPEGTIRLTDSRASRWQLTVSPDGANVAFLSPDRKFENGNIARLDLVTRVRATVLGPIDKIMIPVWMNSHEVGCLEYEHGRDLRLVYPEGLGRSPLDLKGLAIPGTAFARLEGTELIISDLNTRRSNASRACLWRVAISTGAASPILDIQPSRFFEAMSADGKYWAGWDVKKKNLVYLNLENDDMKQLTPVRDKLRSQKRRLESLSLSPDGKQLAIACQSDTIRSEALAFVNISSWKLRKNLGHIVSAGEPNDSRSLWIVVSNLDASRWVALANMASGILPSVLWHPDGKHLIAQGDGHLWLIPLPQHLWSKPAPGYKGGE